MNKGRNSDRRFAQFPYLTFKFIFYATNLSERLYSYHGNRFTLSLNKIFGFVNSHCILRADESPLVHISHFPKHSWELGSAMKLSVACCQLQGQSRKQHEKFISSLFFYFQCGNLVDTSRVCGMTTHARSF